MQPAKACPAGRFPSPPPILEVDRFVEELRRGYSSRGQAVHLRRIPPKSPSYADLSDPLPGRLGDTLRNIGVSRLYTHQFAAIEAARAGKQPTGRPSAATSEPLMKQESTIATTESHALVFDLETQRSAEEVGGWEHRHRMGLAVGVVYDLDCAEFRVYTERQVDGLIRELVHARLIIGFNLKRFDYDVLRGYADVDWNALPTLDILECIHRRLGFRLKLDHLTQETLGERKSADGLQSLVWFKAGEIERVIEYCKQDVLLTKRLYDFGRQHGYLLYRDLQGRAVRLPVDFDEKLFSR